jgi:hypothetical protein
MGSSAFEPLVFGSGGSMFSMARVIRPGSTLSVNTTSTLLDVVVVVRQPCCPSCRFALKLQQKGMQTFVYETTTSSI